MPAAPREKRRSLKTYNAKRDFTRTQEPRGEAGKENGRAYLIQKHAARRLHYDFRLEHDGVLLSWAAPKGPSLNPKDRRLAVRTEDHPVTYGDFEGVIPKGEYGGGTVMLWDRGRWTPRGDVDAGLEKGELKFTLYGERLSGDWVLVRMNEERGRENWLLIKERDKAARDAVGPVAELDVSVKTGRGMQDIAAGADVKAPAAKTASVKRTLARPAFAAPQLATLVSDAPEGDGWLHEIKFDGYRAICALGKGGARIFTRSGKDWTEKFRTLVPDLERLGVKSALLDGEICVVDSEGRTDFKLLKDTLGGGPQPLTLFLFDILKLDGRSLVRRPLVERKEMLRALFGGPDIIGQVRYSDHVAGRGAAFHEQACKAGLEGIISKKADARYVSARSRTWLKTKCIRRQEFVVGGYSPSEKNPRGVASLLLGVWEGDALHYSGRVGTGFSAAQTREWKRRLDATCAPNPFGDIPRAMARGAVFARPEHVVEVQFLEWTQDGRLRHPSFVALREDKKPEDIVRETPKPPPAETKAKGGAVAKPGSKARSGDDAATLAGVRLTHPDRVLWPDQGITKRRLAEYYLAVADRILPFLKDRPVSILRCPEGQGGECFYQRHIWAGAPEQIGRVTVPEREGEGDYLLFQTPAALVAAAQIGALELHPWGARIDDLERPDTMIFDLDPGPDVDFAAVKQAAREVRGVLESVGLTSFLKATGGKGLHVVAPLTRRREWKEVKAFARAVAERMEEADPARYVANMAKKRRSGRIFVDYLRNDRMNTAIAPYSTRARAGAPVGAPLSWDELDTLKSPAAWTLGSMEKRLAKMKADPWAEMPGLRQSITAAAMKAMGAE